MRAYYCDHFEVPLPPEHRFPMEKYARLRGTLLAERVFGESELIAADEAPLDLLHKVHSSHYVERMLAGELDRRTVRRTGFPWSRELMQRSLASVGATLEATRTALVDGLSGALSGGTHHAHRDHGAGYCIFNDLAVCAQWALDQARVQRVLVFDVDVHQGDGTAEIFQDETRVFTCSLHGENNFPFRKPKSDLDIALPDGTEDEAYIEALERGLRQALHQSRPDLVFVQAGVDALREDRLGRLHLSLDGLAERDRRIQETFFLRAGLPVVMTLGGGYSEPLEISIRAHVNTYRIAKALHS